MGRAALVLALLAATPARADRKAEREARALSREARRLAEAGDYDGAADMLRTAYERFPGPKILVNLAGVLEVAGRPVEAAATYDAFLAHEGVSARDKARVREKLAEIEATLGRLRIAVDPPDAKVTVDGKPVAPSGEGIVLRVVPGGHAILATKQGLQPAAETLAIAAGEERTVALSLRAEEPAPVEIPPPPRESVATESSPPPDVPGVAVRAEPIPGRDPSHAGQLGVLARLDVDGSHGDGGVGVVALTYGLGRLADAAAGAMLGSNKGIWVGANVFFLRGALKPLITVGAPIFFVGGARPGVHGAAGLLWDASRHVGILAQAGVQHYPSVPQGFDKTAFVPSGGVQGRF
jgi:hypothetical protein